MGGHHWTDEEIADVCRAVEDGNTQKAIALEYGVTETAIRKLLERTRNFNGVPQGTKWTDEKVALAKQMQNEGHLIGAIAVHFGVSYNSIQKLLCRARCGNIKPVPARTYQKRQWTLGSGRDKHPLADPLLAALFRHHRRLAPESLLRRLLPATADLPTNLVALRKVRLREKFKQPSIKPLSPLLPPRKYPSLRSIMERVLISRDLSEVEFMARSRAPRAVEARGEFFVLAAQETLCSLAEIGRTVDRDHTTVLHAITRYCERHDIPHPRGQVLSRSLRSRIAARRAAEARAVA